MKKKVLSALLCVAMFATALPGCAISTTKESDDGSVESTEDTDSAEDTDTEDAAADAVVLGSGALCAGSI